MRIIARLDIKNNYVIKGINFEGLRKIGSPTELCSKYYKEGADELVLFDSVASLYSRDNIFEIIKKITEKVFIPVCVGGGIRSLEDIKMALYSGADKVLINTAIVKNISFLKEAKQNFGASNIVVSIEAKKSDNSWEVYTNSGRDKTNIDVFDWIQKVQDIGCGEIVLTSIDHDGTRQGLDLNLIKKIKNIKVDVPLIFSGGVGKIEHIKELKDIFPDEALAIASALHYNNLNISQVKKIL